MLNDFVAFQMAKDFYQTCKRLRVPRHMQDQLLRASASVALNLAEGSGKRTTGEQVRFYGIALGSLRECEAILLLEKIELGEDKKVLLRQLGASLVKLSKRRPQTVDAER